MADLEKPGTLPKPGLIGRALRVLLGALLLYLFLRVRITLRPETPPNVAALVLLTLLCLFGVAEIVGNFKPEWRWPAAASTLALAAAADGVDLLQHGRPWGPALGVFFLITVKGVLLLAGLSFFVAAAYATPG